MKIKIIAIIMLLSVFIEAADFISAVSLQRVKNTMESISNGDAVIIDDGNGAFYGVHKIAFNLDYISGNLIVEIYASKDSGTTWKKILQVTPSAKPATGAWTTTCYWDSRKAYTENEGGWTADDAKNPYEGNIKLKLKVRKKAQ